MIAHWNQFYFALFTLSIFSFPFYDLKPPVKYTSPGHQRFLAQRRERYAQWKQTNTEKYTKGLTRMKTRYAKVKNEDEESYQKMLSGSRIRNSVNRLSKKYGRKMPGGRYDHKLYFEKLGEKDKHLVKQQEFQTAADLLGTIHKGLADVIGSQATEHEHEIIRLEKEMDVIHKKGRETKK